MLIQNKGEVNMGAKKYINKEDLIDSLIANRGNVIKVSLALGISPKTVYAYMAELRIENNFRVPTTHKVCPHCKGLFLRSETVNGTCRPCRSKALKLYVANPEVAKHRKNYFQLYHKMYTGDDQYKSQTKEIKARVIPLFKDTHKKKLDEKLLHMYTVLEGGKLTFLSLSMVKSVSGMTLQDGAEQLGCTQETLQHFVNFYNRKRIKIAMK